MRWPKKSRRVGFNRPKAISCLATGVVRTGNSPDHLVSIARRRLVVLRPVWDDLCVSLRDEVSIARRRLVVLRRSPKGWSQMGNTWSFNRPKAISCLATSSAMQMTRHWTPVSIARRRLVVLRPHGPDHPDRCCPGFQSPEGD